MPAPHPLPWPSPAHPFVAPRTRLFRTRWHLTLSRSRTLIWPSAHSSSATVGVRFSRLMMRLRVSSVRSRPSAPSPPPTSSSPPTTAVRHRHRNAVPRACMRAVPSAARTRTVMCACALYCSTRACTPHRTARMRRAPHRAHAPYTAPRACAIHRTVPSPSLPLAATVNLGQHRLPSNKNNVYDHDIRIPMVLRGPVCCRDSQPWLLDSHTSFDSNNPTTAAPIAARQGIPPATTFEQPASNVDVAPTLLGLAGLPPSALAHMDGRSVAPLLIPPGASGLPDSVAAH
eukprot:5781755-Prymnesium_polylepis.1